MAQINLPAALDISDTEPFTKSALDAAFNYIVQRFLLIEAFKPQYQEAIDTLSQFGLDRLNQAIQPIYDELVTISHLGVMFTANSASTVTTAIGTAMFKLSDIDVGRFAPAAYLAAQSTDNTDVILTGHLIGYDRDTGILTMGVDQVAGPTGQTFSNWIITPTSTPNLLATAHSVGAYTMAETDANIAALGNTLIGTAPGNRQTLGAINDAVVAAQTTISAVNTGSTSGLANLGQILQRFQSDEGLIASLFTQVGNRLRWDGAQGLTQPQQTQALANLGGPTFIRGYLNVNPTTITSTAAYAPDIPTLNSYYQLGSFDFTATAKNLSVNGTATISNGDGRGPVDIAMRILIQDITAGATVVVGPDSVVTIGPNTYAGAGVANPMAAVGNLTIGNTYRIIMQGNKNQSYGPLAVGLTMIGINV